MMPCLAVAACGVLAVAGAAQATNFTTDDGWQVNLDTSVAAGVSVRASPRDKSFIGLQNGGYAVAPTADDGTLNYGAGAITSAPFRLTEEVQIKRDDYGLFLRAFGFWDPYYDGTIKPAFRKFNRAAARDLGADLRLLDAYVFDSTQIAGHRVSFKLGNQVVNWGESSYLPGGINSFSAFNINALESAGAELREAVLPIPAAETRIMLTDHLSLEAVYQFAWVRSRFEPDGSFFSIIDSLSDGGRYIAFDPALPDALSSEHLVNIASNNVFGAVVPRVTDRYPGNAGEFGVALRWLVPALDSTELGLYFESYSSRTPFVDFRTGTQASIVPTEIQLLLHTPGNPYGSTAAYRADYPTGIKLLGASFSTNIWDGWGLQGEISHRFDQPILLNTVSGLSKLLGPYICPLAQTLRAIGMTANADQLQASCNAVHQSPVTALTGGFPGYSSFFDSWTRFQVTQAQATAVKIFDPIDRLGISSWTAVAELGANYLSNLPHDRRIFDSATANARDGVGPAIIALAAPSKKGLVTQMAASFAGSLSADMPNILPHSIDLQPFAAMNYGIAGRDATGAGYFQQGQAAVTVGANFIYLTNYKFNISYTNHVSIGPSNSYPLTDRDFVSASLSAAF